LFLKCTMHRRTDRSDTPPLNFRKLIIKLKPSLFKHWTIGQKEKLAEGKEIL